MDRIKVFVLSSLQSAMAGSTGTDGAPSASTSNCAGMLTAGVGPIVVFLVPGDEAPAIVVLVLPGDEAPARAAAFFASPIGRRTGERAGGYLGLVTIVDTYTTRSGPGTTRAPGEPPCKRLNVIRSCPLHLITTDQDGVWCWR